MRRSSCVVLIVAVVLLGVAGLLYLRGLDTQAGPMTPQAASAFLQRGKKATEERDVEGIMDLISPNARILGQTPEQMRALLSRSMRELGSGHFTVVINGVEAKQEGGKAYISFDMDLDQHTSAADTHYYHAHISLALEK